MILNLTLILPDEMPAREVAAYLLEQAESAAGQLEHEIIALPAIDENIFIAVEDGREAFFWRSE